MRSPIPPTLDLGAGHAVRHIGEITGAARQAIFQLADPVQVGNRWAVPGFESRAGTCRATTHLVT